MILLAMLIKQNFAESSLIERQAIWVLYIIICFIGTIVAISPSLFKGKTVSNEKENKFIGHHPSCKNFSTHTLQIKNRRYCAGCLGLALGGLISITLSLIFLITSIKIGYGWFLSITGSILVILGLFQHRIDADNPIFHLLLNIGFVLGTTLLLLGVDILTMNIFVEANFLAITVFWIQTRIIASNEDHKQICLSCGLKCSESFEIPN
jgi:hypothetical protein